MPPHAALLQSCEVYREICLSQLEQGGGGQNPMSKTSKKLDRNTIQRVLQLIPPLAKGMVILTLTLALITVVTTLLAPVLAGRAVDKIVGAEQVDYQGLGRIALAMAATIACTALSNG